MSNVLLVGEKRKRISTLKAETFKQAINTLPIQVDHKDNDKIIGLLYEIAREEGLSSYDAAYLELASRKSLPISTLDKALLRSAKNLKVEVFDP